MMDMQRQIYVCSKCQKTFPRKWNAERHGSSVHKGLSKIGAQLGNEAKTANPLGILTIPQLVTLLSQKPKSQIPVDL